MPDIIDVISKRLSGTLPDYKNPSKIQESQLHEIMRTQILDIIMRTESLRDSQVIRYVQYKWGFFFGENRQGLGKSIEERTKQMIGETKEQERQSSGLARSPSTQVGAFMNARFEEEIRMGCSSNSSPSISIYIYLNEEEGKSVCIYGQRNHPLTQKASCYLGQRLSPVFPVKCPSSTIEVLVT